MLAYRPRLFGPALLMTALLGGAAPAYAQGTQDPAPASEEVVFLSSNMVQGDLVKVDLAAQRFVVKPPNSTEVELRLNRRTTVAGVDDVRQLASRAGVRVSVRFFRDGTDKVATSIRVHPKLESGQRREQPTLR